MIEGYKQKEEVSGIFSDSILLVADLCLATKFIARKWRSPSHVTHDDSPSHSSEQGVFLALSGLLNSLISSL
jgi:hypothetical protein